MSKRALKVATTAIVLVTLLGFGYLLGRADSVVPEAESGLSRRGTRGKGRLLPRNRGDRAGRDANRRFGNGHA